MREQTKPGDLSLLPSCWWWMNKNVLTCAVQMLLVALSRRMCCSRVCMAMRSAGAPCASLLTPASHLEVLSTDQLADRRQPMRREVSTRMCGAVH